MELHRRASFGLPLVWLVLGLIAVITDLNSVFWMVVGGLVALLALWRLIVNLRPFHFRITPDGLETRKAGELRPWSAFEALRLDYVRLVELKDGKTEVLLLDLLRVKESADDIAKMLSAYAGSRFTDLRRAGTFAVALRGYDRGQVDLLIDKVKTAPSREAAQALVDGANFTVVLRGYERADVDAYLKELALTR